MKLLPVTRNLNKREKIFIFFYHIYIYYAEYKYMKGEKIDEFFNLIPDKKFGFTVMKVITKIQMNCVKLLLMKWKLNYEFNVLEDNYKTYVKENNIIRDIPAETEVLKRIFLDGFKPIEGRKQFIMANTDTIYEFLSQKIESYMNDFEVLATENLKISK